MGKWRTKKIPKRLIPFGFFITFKLGNYRRLQIQSEILKESSKN